MAEGQPVPRKVLAERLEVPDETVNRILDGWPGVFSDNERRIVGYWGCPFQRLTAVHTH